MTEFLRLPMTYDRDSEIMQHATGVQILEALHLHLTLHPIIEYQNRYSVTRKTFFYEYNDKILRPINN
jgi:hypothetical protein